MLAIDILSTCLIYACFSVINLKSVYQLTQQ